MQKAQFKSGFFNQSTAEESLLQTQKSLRELAKNTRKKERSGILAEIEETRGCNND